MGVVFIDTETTGLDPVKHAIWEVGLIDAELVEHTWMVALTETEINNADQFAMDIGKFHERHPQGFMTKVPDRLTPGEKGWAKREHSSAGAWTKDYVAKIVASLTWGHHLVGAVPSFDEERLRRLLDVFNIPHRWHYHLVDIEALAAGKLGIAPPWNSHELSAAVGVDESLFTAHEALSDARWAKAVYDSVLVLGVIKVEPEDSPSPVAETEAVLAALSWNPPFHELDRI
jgi:oligoribonuclease (3'-5' exoribonuclease)